MPTPIPPVTWERHLKEKKNERQQDIEMQTFGDEFPRQEQEENK